MEFIMNTNDLAELNGITTTAACSVVCTGVFATCTQGFTCNSSLFM